MAKILCIEDSQDTIAILEVLLEEHDTKFAKSVREAGQLLGRSEFDLILLDIELPDGSGIEFMAKLQGERRNQAVIFLTGKKDFGSKASAFSLGAEDFVVKPFDPQELKLRVDSRLKKRARAAGELRILRFGKLICHLDEQRVESKSRSVELTSLEFKILVLLVKTPNKIFTRAEILDKAWGDSVSVTERAVDVHISNLRKKLVRSGVTIDGVVGTGYRILETELP